MKARPTDSTGWRELLTSADVDRALELEERRIREAQQRIQQLQSYRNSLSPTCRIPQEVLGEIFVALASNFARNLYYHGPPPKPRWHWIVVITVCRHWHEVALHTPRMWGYVMLRPHDLASFSTSRTRSGRAPLTLIQPESYYKHPIPHEMLQGIVSEFHRIQELSFVLSKSLVRLSEKASGTLDAPRLHTLSVCASIPATRISFPTISDAHWPALSSLQTISASFALLQALIRPSLTRLEVEHLSVRQPVVAWVNLLRDLSNLEVLIIVAGIADLGISVNVVPQPTRTVTLPKLTQIQLKEAGVGSASADFLNHLVLPARCHRTFCTNTAGSEEELRFVLSACAAKALGRGIIGGSMDPVRVWDLDGFLGKACFRIYTEDVSACEDIRDDQHPLSVDDLDTGGAEFISIEGPADRIIQTFISVYPLQQVHGLRVDSMIEVNNWQTISCLPNLRQMYFIHADEAVETLLKFLPQAVSFPKLEALIMQGITWHRPHTRLKKRRSRRDALLPTLVHALEVRNERGQRLKQLALSYGINLERKYRGHEDLERLKELVDIFTYEYCDLDESMMSYKCDTCSEDAEDDVNSMASFSEWE